MKQTVCYISNKSEHVNKKDIQEIFETTQKNNKSRNITGILLYLENSFFQVLEGDRQELVAVFNTIEMDDRHENIFVVIDKPIDKQTFKDYKSGFSIVKNSEDLQNLNKYLNETSTSIEESKNILNIIQPFLL